MYSGVGYLFAKAPKEEPVQKWQFGLCKLCAKGKEREDGRIYCEQYNQISDRDQVCKCYQEKKS